MSPFFKFGVVLLPPFVFTFRKIDKTIMKLVAIISPPCIVLRYCYISIQFDSFRLKLPQMPSSIKRMTNIQIERRCTTTRDITRNAKSFTYSYLSKHMHIYLFNAIRYQI